MEQERDKVRTALAMEIENRELAQVRRHAAQVEQATVAELLAMEAESVPDSVTVVSGQAQDTEDSRSEASITELVRGLVVLGVRDKDTVLAAVRTALGPETKESSVIRTLARVTSA